MNAKGTLVVAVAASFAAAFSGGCAVAPTAQAPLVKPLVEVRHSGLQADGYYQLGRFLQSQSRYQEAEEAYRRALALDPVSVDAHNGLGTLHAVNGRFEEAHRSFNAALAIAPHNGAVLNNVGYAHLLEGRGVQAADAFRRAVLAEPGNGRYRVNLEIALTGGSHQAADAAAAPEPGRDAAHDPVDVPTQPAASPHGEASVAQLVPAGPHTFELIMPLPSEVKRTAVARVAPPSRVGLEVSNGHGASGMARRVAGQLESVGLPVKRLTNQLPYGKAATLIQYRPGNEQAARDLSRRLPGRPDVVESAALRAGVDVRLVLGQDLPRDFALVSPPQRVATAFR